MLIASMSIRSPDRLISHVVERRSFSVSSVHFIQHPAAAACSAEVVVETYFDRTNMSDIDEMDFNGLKTNDAFVYILMSCVVIKLS